MKIKTLIVTLASTFAAAAICVAADTQIEQAVRDLDAHWSAAAGAKDVEKTVSYYSADAIVMPPNASAATTKKAIRTLWKDALAVTIHGSWKATRVEVAHSGDMACVSGTYKWSSNDASGKRVSDHGKYLEVWAKQADGKWKCRADIWNSDLPAPSEKK